MAWSQALWQVMASHPQGTIDEVSQHGSCVILLLLGMKIQESE